MENWCYRCKTNKVVDEFYKNRETGKPCSKCIECEQADRDKMNGFYDEDADKQAFAWIWSNVDSWRKKIY